MSIINHPGSRIPFLLALVSALVFLTASTDAAANVPFNISKLNVSAVNGSGEPETQAGGHPAELSTAVEFASEEVETLGSLKVMKKVPGQDPRDISITLPAGAVGDPLAVPRCPLAVFNAGAPQWCQATTQVGTADIFYGDLEFEDGVYNLEPPPGRPAELGITTPLGTNFVLGATVRASEGYRLNTESKGTPMVGLVKAIVTIWGVPAASTHDPLRGRDCTFFETDNETLCKEGRTGGEKSNLPLKPFLTMPTQCSGEPLEVEAAADSWQKPGPVTTDGGAELQSSLWKLRDVTLPAMTGCDALSFDPSLEVQPETVQADSPTGMNLTLEVPQTDTPESSATPEVRDASVTLPAGMSLSAAAANGVEACSDAAFAVLSSVSEACPEGSRIGTATVETPLLDHPLEGELYLAEPECGNTTHQRTSCDAQMALEGKIFRVFLQVSGSGVTVKLPGTVSVNPLTGQITTSFRETPQLPFSRLRLHIKGGPLAPLANSQNCGEAETTSDLTPWSSPSITPEGLEIPGTPDAMPTSRYYVSGCDVPAPFAPSFTAGTASTAAASFSPFSLTISRRDREANISSLQVTTPKGVLGILAGVPLCGEPQARLGTCAEASRIGTTHVSSGAGLEPLWLEGPVYLTTGYKGAPFGLSIVVPAAAGPFNLGDVIVQASVSVDSHTSEITVTSDPLPQFVDGVPTRLRTVTAIIDRPHFIFNPTNCSRLQVDATIAASQGSSNHVSSPFAVSGCKNLPFRPSFSVSSQGSGITRRYGASLDVKVSQKRGEANIGSVAVSLPRFLPSRLTTLKQACPAATFAADPADCPTGSDVGVVTASTPILPVKMMGPVYIVSHGGAAFPDIVVVLQGYGVRIDLVGKVLITKDGITHTSFGDVPDAPISSFEMRLPESTHSAVASPSGNLCGKKLIMPTRITGQNGAVVRQQTKIKLTGCVGRASASSKNPRSDNARSRGTRRAK